MDCSEDDGGGVDGRANPPYSLYNMLFTQHSEKAVENYTTEVWKSLTYPSPKC